MSASTSTVQGGYSLVTGGAGFVGANLAHRLLADGDRVVLLDNLSRRGVEHNLQAIVQAGGDRVTVVSADVRDAAAVAQALEGARRVFHLAAQVAVTTSLADPTMDFEINARGTLNVLEAARRQSTPPAMIFSSTNKVYGALNGIGLRRYGKRWLPADPGVRRYGVAETQPVDFHSPYGCSKGSADHYVIDYARTFGLPALVFRMSCIYGPRQHGNEDQGWVAHFLRQAARRSPITIFGDGHQVRDVLFVDDLVEAMITASERAAQLRGQVFNVGGGSDHTVSLLELIESIQHLVGRELDVSFAPPRPGDQRYYVSDTRKASHELSWQPRVALSAGLERSWTWLTSAEGAPVV